MRVLGGIVLLLGVLPALIAGCATRGWVREVVDKQGLETDRRVTALQDRLVAETQRIEGRVSTVEGSMQEVKGAAQGAGERADAAFERSEAAHGRADAAFARADDVDARLTRLWSTRHARSVVDTLEVTFGFDRASLDDSAQTALLALIRELQANPNLTVDLAGYTDPTGPREYNYQLSQRRVEAVRRFLVEKGVELPRIHAIGLGPLDNTGVPNAKKRRVTVRLMVASE